MATTRTHSTCDQAVCVGSPCRRPSRPSVERSTQRQSEDRQNGMPRRAGCSPGRGDTLSVTFGTGDRLLFLGDGAAGASCGCLMKRSLGREATGEKEKEMVPWGWQQVCSHRTARPMTLGSCLPS